MLKRKLAELSNGLTALVKTKVPVPPIVLVFMVMIVNATLNWVGLLELITFPLFLIWLCARELK